MKKILLLLIATLSVSWVHADTILEEGFEDNILYKVLWNPGFGLYSAGTSIEGEKKSALTFQEMPKKGFEESYQCLRYQNQYGDGPLRLLYKAQEGDLNPEKKTTVQFDYYFEGSSADSYPLQPMYLFIDDGKGTLMEGLSLMFYNTEREISNVIENLREPLTSGKQLAVNTWYRYILTVNPLNTGDDSFDLKVLENSKGKSKLFLEVKDLHISSDISEIKRVFFEPWGQKEAHTAYFDNIIIKQ